MVDRTLQRKTSVRWEEKHENDDRSSGEMNIKTNFRNEQACVQIKRHSREFITFSGSSAMTNVHVFTHTSSVEKKTFLNYLMGNNMTTHHPAIFFTLFISRSEYTHVQWSFSVVFCFFSVHFIQSREKEKKRIEIKPSKVQWNAFGRFYFVELNRRKAVKITTSEKA